MHAREVFAKSFCSGPSSPNFSEAMSLFIRIENTRVAPLVWPPNRNTTSDRTRRTTRITRKFHENATVTSRCPMDEYCENEHSLQYIFANNISTFFFEFLFWSRADVRFLLFASFSSYTNENRTPSTVACSFSYFLSCSIYLRA